MADIDFSWPKAIAPVDPGFVLVKADPWYDSQEEARKFKDNNNYNKRPSQDLIKAAQKVRKDVILPGNKRPAEQMSSNSPDGSRQGSPSRRHEILEIVNGKLMARDQVFNTTRPLSPEEIRNEIEIRECSDRMCTRERRDAAGELGKAAAVMVPGLEGPDLPSANGAVPTGAATLMTRQGGAALERTPVTAAVPGITKLPSKIQMV